MDTNKRREEIVRMLSQKDIMLTGKELAGQFKVSRQVIVQDIAVLRARGEKIIATLRGYMMEKSIDGKLRVTIACCHTPDQIETELGIILDLGGAIIDVIVAHPLYGDLKGNLMLRSRRDLHFFLQRLLKTKAKPLSSLTGGVHLHTIELRSEKELEEIRMRLDAQGILVRDD